MKHDVFDVPIGLLREFVAMAEDYPVRGGHPMLAGVFISESQYDLLREGDPLIGRYVVVSSYAVFGHESFGSVFTVGSGYYTLLDVALSFVDWQYAADTDSLHECVTFFGHDYEVWHIVEDVPSGSSSDALCPSDSVEDGSCADDLAPELPAMALEVLRQLRDAGELGDPDELTDDDFFDATCYTGELPLGVVTRSDSGCVFLPCDNVMLYGCEWVRFVPRSDCHGSFWDDESMTYHLSDRTGIWNMLHVAYADLDGDGWYNNYEDDIRTLCRELFFGPKSDGCYNPLWFCCHDELERLGLDLKFGFDFGPARYEYNPPAPAAVSQDDAYWDTLLSPPVEDEDFDDWFDSLVEHAAPAPVNTWHEIDIQCELPAVL